MRGVTGSSDDVLRGVDISTRTPHAGSDGVHVGQLAHRVISTRTPHAGSDRVGRLVLCAGDISTRTPHAGSDLQARDEAGLELISTRTPHAGSDSHGAASGLRRRNFNPHSPCGE